MLLVVTCRELGSSSGLFRLGTFLAFGGFFDAACFLILSNMILAFLIFSSLTRSYSGRSVVFFLFLYSYLVLDVRDAAPGFFLVAKCAFY